MEYQFDLQIILEYWPMILDGIKITVFVSIISAFLSVLIGFFMALGRRSLNKYVRFFSGAYVEFFRNTPLLVQMYFFYNMIPKVKEFMPEVVSNILISPLTCGIIALTIYTSAYITEVVRAGLQSIAKEQFEAARALGLNSFQTMHMIIIPQAIRIIIPPLSNQFINLAKNSSLVSTITVTDIFYVSWKIAVDDFKFMEAFLLACIVYMTLVGIISLCANLLEHKFRIPGRC